jgi:hypothetical protein
VTGHIIAGISAPCQGEYLPLLLQFLSATPCITLKTGHTIDMSGHKFDQTQTERLCKGTKRAEKKIRSNWHWLSRQDVY